MDRAEVPHDVFALLRMERLIALQKPGGGVGHRVWGLRSEVGGEKHRPTDCSGSAGGHFTFSARSDHKAGGECRRTGSSLSRFSTVVPWRSPLTAPALPTWISSCDVGWTPPSPRG